MIRASYYFDRLMNTIGSPVRNYFLIVMSLVFLVVLFLFYLELQAYLAKGFLLLTGLLLMVIAFWQSRISKKYFDGRSSYWMEV